MEALRLKSAKERAVHYQGEADKFCRLAEAEPVEHIRAQLLALAEQYQSLATSLKPDKRPS